jgi:carbon storage regulator CsrA
MLVLSRRANEKIVFPNLGITVDVLGIKGSVARLGIDAPANVTVMRDELLAQLSDAERIALAAVEKRPNLSHAVRNRLNAVNIALHLFRRQCQAGLESEAERTYERLISEFEKLETEVASPRPDTKSPLKNCRALLIEDDQNESELLAGFLRLTGFDVATAEDGSDALDYLSSHKRPDLVLLDMLMPRCDGPSTVQAIRGNHDYDPMKIFAVSGTSPTTLGVTIGPGGIDRWFPKPINPETLVRELARELHLPTVAA